MYLPACPNRLISSVRSRKVPCTFFFLALLAKYIPISNLSARDYSGKCEQVKQALAKRTNWKNEVDLSLRELYRLGGTKTLVVYEGSDQSERTALNETLQGYIDATVRFEPVIYKFITSEDGQSRESLKKAAVLFAIKKGQQDKDYLNTIPADDVFYLDCRILPSVDLEQFMSRVKEITKGAEKKHGVAITISTVQRASSPPTPVDTPLVSSLKKALAEVYNVEGIPVGIGGGTVGGHLRQAGYDTVVWSRIAETAHMPNEYSLIDNMIGDARVMAYIMLFPEA